MAGAVVALCTVTDVEAGLTQSPVVCAVAAIESPATVAVTVAVQLVPLAVAVPIWVEEVRSYTAIEAPLALVPLMLVEPGQIAVLVMAGAAVVVVQFWMVRTNWPVLVDAVGEL